MDRVPPPPPLPPADGAPDGLIPSAAFLWRNRHWTVPAGALPLMALAGEAAGMAGAHGDVVTGSAVAAAAMWLAAPRKWDRPSEQVYARASVIAAGGWLSAATWLGDSRLMLGALCAGCLAWGVPWWRHKRPRKVRAERRAVAEWDAWWRSQAIHWNLGGSRVADVSSKGAAVTLTVQLWSGRQTSQAVEHALPLLESALSGMVRHGMTRAERDPENPSRVLVFLKRADPLAPEIAWDASMVPASVADPVTIGLAEGGAWVKAPLLSNWFVVGQSRSGKSNELSVLLAAITGVPDARAWLIDRKGGRAARPWMPALDWCATTIDEARLVLTVAAAEVEARAMGAYDGSEQLQPTPEVPALFVILDETHEVTSAMRGDPECARLLAAVASMGMGVAVYVIVLTQYGALEESVRTEQTRSNLPMRVCFRTEYASHGKFALGEGTLLDASKLRGKGTFYWRLGPESPAQQARGPHLPHKVAEQVAGRHGAMPRPSLTLYARDWQGHYDSRWQRLPEPLRHLAPQWDPDAPEAAMPVKRTDAALAAAMRIEEEVAGTPDVEMSALPRVADGDVRASVSRGRAGFARALEQAPEGGIAPRRLVAVSGMSRSWVMGWLAELTRNGTVQKVQDGMYRANPGADVTGAMASARQAQDALLSA